MPKMMPTVGILTNKKMMETSDDNKSYLKICLAIDNQYYWCAVFGAVAKYITEYANIGSSIFVEEWSVNKNENYYDFSIARCKIIKNGGLSTNG
ncbi:MAG: hypothetical protein ACRC5T_03935 [Cetobacterium sp.]